MRAAELLAAEAVDRAGRRLGRVHDIHLARQSRDAPWRIEAVTVGPTALAYRFGYAQGEVVGPAALAALARLLTRRRRRIAWRRVVSYDGRRLVLDP